MDGSREGPVSDQQGSTSLAVTAVPEGWSRFYTDPRLDSLVQVAIAANTDLRMAAANLERSRALLQEAEPAQEPGVMLNGGLLYGQSAGEQYLQRVTPPWDGTTIPNYSSRL